MEIQGRLLEVGETVEVSDRFRKREFVIEYADNPQYPECLKFELVQDKCALLDGYNPGSDVVVHFDLKGRKWTDPQGQVKYFNSLRAWRLNPAGAETEAPTEPSPPPESVGPAPENLGPPDSDELPF